jgi:hypothetical protein
MRGGGGRIGGSRGGGRRVGGSRPGRSGRGGGFGGGFGGGRPRGGYSRRPRRRGGYYGGYFGGGWGRRRYYGGPGYGCGGCFGGMGCLTSLFILIVFFLIMSMFGNMFGGFGLGGLPGSNGNVTPSTRERQPIEAGLVQETDYYTDELGWIQNETTLVNGLRHFYNETNVQPHVYITDNVNGDTNPELDEIDAFTSELYDELFEDEAHLLLLHFESEDYQHGWSYHLEYGSQVNTLMDQEAEDILFDYLDYHIARDIEDEEYFASAFQDTADRIMEETRNPWIPVLLVAGAIVLVALLYTWWKNVLNKDKKTASSSNNEDNQSDSDDFDF